MTEMIRLLGRATLWLVAAAVIFLATPPAGAQTDRKVSQPGWGYYFMAPEGWRWQAGPQGAILGHDTVPGMIQVFPMPATNRTELRQRLNDGIHDGGVQLALAGPVEALGRTALTGRYQGVVNGQTVVGRGLAVLVGRGTGAAVLALSTPQAYGDQLDLAARKIALSFGAEGGAGGDLMSHFAGVWKSYSKHSERSVTLAPDGRYFESSVSSYGGKFDNQGGNWGVANEGRESGRWAVRGDRRQGVLIIISRDGGRESIPYRVHVENGQIYWNEYYFDGALYGKQ